MFHIALSFYKYLTAAYFDVVVIYRPVNDFVYAYLILIKFIPVMDLLK